MDVKEFFEAAVKGCVIGGTMLVPGFSGGSMAMILGVYDRLIRAAAGIGHAGRKQLAFMIAFALGAGAGMLALAGPLLALIERRPRPSLYFFIGAAAGAVPMIRRQAQTEKFSLREATYMLAGALMVILISLLPVNMLHPGAQPGPAYALVLVGAGFLAAGALILPGISVSYFLLTLGLYNPAMRALEQIDVAFLLPMAAGLVLGSVCMAGALERAMRNRPQAAYPIILGFMLGSAAQVFPGLPSGGEWLLCGLCAAAGFGAVRLLSMEKQIWDLLRRKKHRIM